MPETTEHAGDKESTSQTRATVEKKALKPTGLLPKNTQQLVILGVAVVHGAHYVAHGKWQTSHFGNGQYAHTTGAGTGPGDGARL